MKTNFSLLFYLKKTKNYESGPVPVYMRITVDGKRSEIASGRECEPSEWSTGAGRAKGTKERTRSFNAYLDGLQSKVYDAHDLLFKDGKLDSADSIKDLFKGKVANPRMLIEVFTDHNKRVEALVGTDFASGTLERYKTSLKHTLNYLEWKYLLTDIDIKKIDNEFTAGYDYYLRSERKCANNSTVKYLKNFKKIIRICIANGWLTKDPFVNYKAKSETG